jgi:hypothetical protein
MIQMVIKENRVLTTPKAQLRHNSDESYFDPKHKTYDAWTLLGLGISWCRTCVVSNTDTTPTHNYTELCDFLKLLALSVYQCLCPVSGIRAS